MHRRQTGKGSSKSKKGGRLLFCYKEFFLKQMINIWTAFFRNPCLHFPCCPIFERVDDQFMQNQLFFSNWKRIAAEMKLRKIHFRPAHNHVHQWTATVGEQWCGGGAPGKRWGRSFSWGSSTRWSRTTLLPPFSLWSRWAAPWQWALVPHELCGRRTGLVPPVSSQLVAF